VRLVPTGDGTSDHLDKKVEAPGMITLKAGKSTLGRDEPSDIILQIPTVSNTHAELTVGEFHKNKRSPSLAARQKTRCRTIEPYDKFCIHEKSCSHAQSHADIPAYNALPNLPR
jgi:hypothetical protein